MSQIPYNVKKTVVGNIWKIKKRCIGHVNKDVHSKAVRKKFLDFFIKDNNHEFVRSSPVVPFCDPTLPFINAGMNQFKGVLLGTTQPVFSKVANSQKCIRVGGRHNDLNTVGTDGYHHTFFEMLGNWSFGTCSKEESCTLAWKLLTDGYKINRNALYVTYFGGDDEVGLNADLECRDVWRKLGIPDNRILAFGMKENFWEMGLTGPCGPCTEIHYDHLGFTNRASFVNKNLHDLTELWNIVFIEYNRDIAGAIKPLPQKHVDTGMGFERLVAVLQNKTSNYDTDIFKVLFSGIEKNCRNVPKYKGLFGESDWNHLHTGYRILADHVRMVTVSLADGVIPEENAKLRKIIRRAFALCESTFASKPLLLKELSNYVIENLGAAYPELERNSSRVHQVLEYEAQVYSAIRDLAAKEWSKLSEERPALAALDVFEMPGLVQAARELIAVPPPTGKVDADLAYRLYDTHGLDAKAVLELGKALGLECDDNAFQIGLAAAKARSRRKTAEEVQHFTADVSGIPVTDDTAKYNCTKNGEGKYEFPQLHDVKVLRILLDGEFVESASKGTECTLILDRTNLYAEAGGQIGDQDAKIHFASTIFSVQGVTKSESGHVLHKGVLSGGGDALSVGAVGSISFAPETRLALMQNHTATHLLNAVLKELKGATYQKSSRITPNYFTFDVGMFGPKLSVADVEKVEARVIDLIKQSIPLQTVQLEEHDLLALDDVTRLPGEIYQGDIRLVEIRTPTSDDFLSREPCCGTHVQNTSDLVDFAVVAMRSLGRGTQSLHCVTGARAALARANDVKMLEKIATLKKSVEDHIDKPDVLEMGVAAFKERLQPAHEGNDILRVATKKRCIDDLEAVSKQIKQLSKEMLKEFIEMEMRTVLESKKLKSKRSQRPYIVHYLRSSMLLNAVPLQRATKVCEDLPVLVISYSDNVVKARCCVPEGATSATFNAELWLRVISDILGTPLAPTPKGENAALACNLKGKRINVLEWHALLNDSLNAAKIYAEKHL